MVFNSVISKTKWILAFACLSMFALGLADNLRGPLFPELIDYFRLSNTEASLSYAVTSMLQMVGNLTAERLLRRISISRLLVSSLFLMGVSLFFMGLVEHFSFYLAAAGLFGLSMGWLGIAQNLIVAESMQGPNQTKALSGLHGLYGLSSLAAPFLASFSPALFGAWRSGFFVTAAVAVVVFIFAIRIRPDQPIAHVEHQEDTLLVGVGRRSIYLLLVFGGIIAFYGVAENLISSRLALYMRDYFQMDLKHSSLYVTYFFTFMLMGRVAFTVKKFGATLRKQINVLLGLSLFCLLLGLLVHPFFLALTGLAMAPFYPLAIAYLSEQTRRQKRKFITFAMGLQNLCLICMHLAVGYLTDQFGLLYAFGVGVISLVLALICVNFHPRIGGPKSNPS